MILTGAILTVFFLLIAVFAWGYQSGHDAGYEIGREVGWEEAGGPTLDPLDI